MYRHILKYKLRCAIATMQYFSARRCANIYKVIVTPLSAMYRNTFTVTTH